MPALMQYHWTLTLKLAPVQMAWTLGVEPNLFKGCFETGYQFNTFSWNWLGSLPIVVTAKLVTGISVRAGTGYQLFFGFHWNRQGNLYAKNSVGWFRYRYREKNHYFRCFVIFSFRIDWGIESHIFVMFLSYSSSDTGSFGRFETINPLDSDTKQAWVGNEWP